MKSIPTFPYPNREYVFEIDKELLQCDNNYVVYIGVKKICDEDNEFDDGSNYGMEYNEFYDWMDMVGEYLSIELDNMGDGAWQAINDNGRGWNAQTKILIEFLRKHQNFTELKE